VILIDSSVLFDHTRGLDSSLSVLLSSLPVAICGVTRTEAFHGVRTGKERADLLKTMNSYYQVPTPESVWDEIGDNLALLRSKGLTVPIPDVILATVAIHHDLEIWARDQHFPLMQKFLPALRLFPEPP
jgi:predicted nucleic acid-binding protein